MESSVVQASPVVEERLTPYESLAAIGSRPSSLRVVRAAGAAARSKLMVAETFPGAARAGDPVAARFVAAAHRVSTLANANLARVREMAVRGDDLVVFWDFIDGEALSGFWLSAAAPLEVTLRLILDVLSGVGAIHELRDDRQQPMKLAHGEVSPATVVLGLDGMARVLHAIGRCVPGAPVDAVSLPYLAPEVQAGEAYDARADVHGAGVMLREALSGSRNRRGEVVLAAPWAGALVAIAEKATAPAPDDRWPTAAIMAAEIRKVLGLRLATATAAATFARGTFGDRVKARRDRLESAIAAPRSSRSDARPGGADAPAPTITSASPVARPWAEDDTDVALVADSSSPTPRRSSPIPSSIDPVTDSALIVPSPPPLPTRLHPVSAPLPATVVDVPASLGPPPSEGASTSPGSGSSPPVDPAVRRRRTIVLGSVGALGLIVFALAGLRAAYRSPDRLRSTAVATDSPLSAAAVPPPVSPDRSSNVRTVPVGVPVAPPTASHAPREVSQGSPVRRPNAASPRAPARPSPAPAPRLKPSRSRASFDPASP